MSNRGVRGGGRRARRVPGAVARLGLSMVAAGLLAAAAVSFAPSVTAAPAAPVARGGASALSSSTLSEYADPSISYVGEWMRDSTAVGPMMTLNGSGSVEYGFVGTSVTWTGLRSWTSGVADVFLDGVLITTVDGFAPGSRRETLFETAGLTEAAHVLRVVPTGRHHARATGSSVSIAGFGASTVPAGAAGAEGQAGRSEQRGLLGIRLDVDPSSTVTQAIAAAPAATRSALAPISSQPLASWFGEWNTDVLSDVRTRVRAADARGSVATLVMYAIPHRDCGGYSANTGSTAEGYRAWVREFVAGLGSTRQIVIVEPDALLLTDCLSPAERTERSALLSYAVEAVSAQGSAAYLDAGHSAWLSAADTAERLRAAGVSAAAGFSLNVSNTQPTDREIAHGTAVSTLLSGVHFVIDTGRNGGSVSPGEWCNPRGAGLGRAPTTETGSPLVDAYLWIKPPGESDGTCNGGPAAGVWSENHARALVVNAAR